MSLGNLIFFGIPALIILLAVVIIHRTSAPIQFSIIDFLALPFAFIPAGLVVADDFRVFALVLMYQITGVSMGWALMRKSSLWAGSRFASAFSIVAGGWCGVALGVAMVAIAWSLR